jgi:hypothetical protein
MGEITFVSNVTYICYFSVLYKMTEIGYFFRTAWLILNNIQHNDIIIYENGTLYERIINYRELSESNEVMSSLSDNPIYTVVSFCLG